MVLKFEELEVLRAAEGVADDIWRQVVRWEPFGRELSGGNWQRRGILSGRTLLRLTDVSITGRSSSSCIMPVAASLRPSTGSTGHGSAS
jgi:hypothetical protein